MVISDTLSDPKEMTVYLKVVMIGLNRNAITSGEFRITHINRRTKLNGTIRTVNMFTRGKRVRLLQLSKHLID